MIEYQTCIKTSKKLRYFCYVVIVKFTGLTVLGSFTGQLLSGHRC